MVHPLASLKVTISPVGENVVEVVTNFGLAMEGDFTPIAPWELELLGEPAGRKDHKSASFNWLTPCCRVKASRLVRPAPGGGATYAFCGHCQEPLSDVFLQAPSSFTGVFALAALEAMGVKCGLDALTAVLAGDALMKILEGHTERRWAGEALAAETFNLAQATLTGAF